MNTLESMKTRRSIRNFKEDAVPDELIEKIVEAGSYAASGKGRQSPIIIVVENKDVIKKFSKMNASIIGVNIDPFYQAPLLMIVLADKTISTHIYDGSLVIGNMMLACHELGLGSCWIHRAKEEFETDEGKEFLKELGITGDYEGIGHLIVGFTDKHPNPAKRKENYIYYVK